MWEKREIQKDFEILSEGTAKNYLHPNYKNQTLKRHIWDNQGNLKMNSLVNETIGLLLILLGKMTRLCLCKKITILLQLPAVICWDTWNIYRKSWKLPILNKGPSGQGYGFPAVMYGCESWTGKKAEYWRIDAFELWCWRRFLRVPWTARRSNQSILKEISPGSSLEGLMLKLKLQYFGHLMRRVDSLEKTLMLGGIGGRRRRGWQRMGWLDGITNSIGMSLSKLRESVMDRGAWHAAIHGVTKNPTGLSDWTQLN